MGVGEGWGRDEDWFAHQLKVFRSMAPARRVSLRELLERRDLSVETLGGSRHFFSRADIEEAAQRLPRELWEARVFPLVFVREGESDLYLLRQRDEARAFSSLLGIVVPRQTERGEFYTYKVLILQFLSKYPSLGLISPG
jgi:uncharacterized protein (UPF0216 family)